MIADISFFLGQLAGSLLVVAGITTVLKKLAFHKYKAQKKNIISVLISIIIATTLYLLITKTFTASYLISGIILFIILQILEKNEKEIASKKLSARPGTCHKCGHKQDKKYKYCQKCSEEMA